MIAPEPPKRQPVPKDAGRKLFQHLPSGWGWGPDRGYETPVGTCVFARILGRLVYEPHVAALEALGRDLTEDEDRAVCRLDAGMGTPFDCAVARSILREARRRKGQGIDMTREEEERAPSENP